MTKAQHDQKVKELQKKYQAGQISLKEYDAAVAQLDYELEKSEKYQDYKAGKITNYAYIQWKKQNNPAVQPQNGAVSAHAPQKAQTPVQTQTPKKAASNAGKTAEQILGITIPDVISDTSVYTGPLMEAYGNGTITHEQYTAAVKKVVSGSTAWQKQKNDQPAAQTGMTPEEYKAAKSAMYQKYKNGEITNYAYIQWKKQNNPEKQASSAAVSAPPGKSGTNAQAEPQAAKKASWTAAEHNDIYDKLYEKKEDGTITDGQLSTFVEQLNKLENDGVKPEQAEKIMKDAVQFVSVNGMTPDEAVSAAKNAPPAVPEPNLPPMTELEQQDLTYAIDQMYDGGQITEKEQIELLKELDDMYNNGESFLDAQYKLGFIAPEQYEDEKKAAINGGTDAAYEKLVDDVNYQVTYGLHDYDEANKLIEMLDYMKDSGIPPEQAQKQLDSALKLMDLNGFTVDEAMNVAAGFQSGMKATPQNASPMTDKEFSKIYDSMTAKVSSGELSAAEFSKKLDELLALKKSGASMAEAEKALWAPKDPNADHPMTTEEMYAIGDQLTEKYKANKITWDEFEALNLKVMEMKSKNANLKDVQAAVGLDPGTLVTEQAVDALEKELKDIYGQAAKEMKKQLEDFEDAYTVKMNKKYQDLQDGKITQEEYDAWVKNQLMHAQIMRDKIDQLSGVMLEANKKAVGMINGEQLHVFADNAAYQAFQITKDTGINLMFSVYDEHTVEKLIKDKPELLPRKVVNGKKDVAWNQQKIANAMVQGILQGESIPKLAKRVAAETASTNMNAMVRYARTAMTAAQNSGRQEMLERATQMGIKCKKVWMATLDGRTRDSHAALDGDAVDIDKKFSNGLMYPGDPNGPPGEVYNCRCTLVYEYEGFPHDPVADQRRDNETGEMIQNMTYSEWKAAKEGSALNDLNIAKTSLAEAQKAIIKAKVKEDKVYSGLWKEDVTLADYEAKKDGIGAKRDYYVTKLDEYTAANAAGESWATDEKIKDLKKKIKLLDEYEENGKLLQKRNEALKKVQSIYDKVGYQKTAVAPAVGQQKAAKKASTPKKTLGTIGAKTTPFSPDAYSKERKDKALWTTSQKKVDTMMRDRTGEVWRHASDREKDAIFDYTQSYHKFNEPLRGIEYGTNRYLGVGKTDLDAGYQHNGDALNAMTEIIDKCSYDHDMWLQRGCGYRGMDKFFGISERLLRDGSEKDLQDALLGKTVTEYGFMSMGSSKGKGFSGDVLLNIYAPSGTKMMFVEPFSYYGHDKHGYKNGMDGRKWDGKSTQPDYGYEFETIMQQGTQFRVTKVEKKYGQVYVDIEVINQDNQQRWKKKR